MENINLYKIQAVYHYNVAKWHAIKYYFFIISENL